MSRPRLIRAVCVWFFIFSQNCIADTNKYTWYRDSNIRFSYPEKSYKSVKRVDDGDTSDHTVLYYDLMRRENDTYDLITACKNSLKFCTEDPYQTLPYWIDNETGKLSLYDFTTAVTHRKARGEDVYEAFPLCSASDASRPHARYGAECYVGVRTNTESTVSLTYWIGDKDHMSASMRLKKIMVARNILLSIKVANRH